MSETPVTSQALTGARLREQRDRLHLRQDQFALFLRTRCGLAWTQTTIADLERGRRKLSLDESQALRQWIGLDKLLHADGPVETLGHVVPAATWNAALPKGTIAKIWTEQSEWTDRVGDVAASLQAEQRLARKLGVPAKDVANAALRIWGLTLTDKREQEFRRTGPTVVGDSPSNRLRRSHITLKLEAQIKEALEVEKLANRTVNRRIRRRMS